MSRRASGLKAWLLQRATAVYIALFGVYLTLYFVLAAPADHAALVAWVTRPWVTLGLLVFVPMILVHAWVGIRDVCMDYLKPVGLRVTVLSLFGLVFLASGLWTVLSLFGLVFLASGLWTVQAIIVAQVA